MQNFAVECDESTGVAVGDRLRVGEVSYARFFFARRRRSILYCCPILSAVLLASLALVSVYGTVIVSIQS